MKRSRILATVAWALTLTATVVQAGQVKLDVSLATPRLLANKKQTTFVKVGLTGFKMETDGKRAPVNVAIVLDKSGSMTGDKIAKAKEAAIAAINRLGKQDIVSVVTYDSTVTVLVPSTRLTDKQTVCDSIRGIQAGGSTALFAGVSKGAAELRKFLDKERINRIILLSDGLANVGPQSPSELGELGASLLKEGISVSTMGLGLDYNEDLMTQLARRSGGNHNFIENAENLVKVFNFEFNDVLSVVAQEAVVDVRLADGIRPVRVLNMDAEINGQNVLVKINQIYSEQEKYVMLEVEVPPGKAGETRDLAEVKVSYANMQTRTTDRLASIIGVSFTDSAAVVEESINRKVMVWCVLQVANEKNELATTLRDKGDVEGARRVLVDNGKYLGDHALTLNSELLKLRCEQNVEQSKNLDGEKWARARKSMRQYQYQDANQQRGVLPDK